MPDLTLDQTVAQMTDPSDYALAQLGEALKGTGGETWKSYREIVKAQSLPGIGQSAAAEIARLRKDDSLPHDHRFRRVNETRDAATIAIRAGNEVSQAAVSQLERDLTADVLPQPHREDSQRTRAREELRARLGGRTGEALVAKARGILGKNPKLDAELTGDFGLSIFDGADLSEEDHAGVKAMAVGVYLQRRDGTERQKAARRALSVFREGKISGCVAAYNAAARLHLVDR